MNILLDTHMLIWVLNGDKRVSARVKQLLMDQKNEVYYSAASIWEVAIKHEKNPQKVPFSAKELDDYCQLADIIPLPVRANHVAGIGELKVRTGESVNGDPFDKLLITQAKLEDMLFITHDTVMCHYDEPCIIVD